MLFLKRFSYWRNHSDYPNLLKNLSSLSLVQISNYILPLITLPYLARVLGPEYYGLVMMAQATMIYFTILTDYGFNLSATKDIAAHQSDTKKVSDIFSAVMGTKCVLLIIGMGVLTILVQTIPFLMPMPFYFTHHS